MKTVILASLLAVATTASASPIVAQFGQGHMSYGQALKLFDRMDPDNEGLMIFLSDQEAQMVASCDPKPGFGATTYQRCDEFIRVAEQGAWTWMMLHRNDLEAMFTKWCSVQFDAEQYRPGGQMLLDYSTMVPLVIGVDKDTPVEWDRCNPKPAVTPQCVEPCSPPPCVEPCNPPSCPDCVIIPTCINCETPTAVPEPGSLVLMGTGALYAVRRWRKRRG